MRESVPSKAPTSLPFTPTQLGLARRSFTVKAVPEITTSQTPPDLQTQLERAERFGHNFANIPIFAPGTPIPPVIQPKLTIRQLRVQDKQETASSSSLPTSPQPAENHEANSKVESQPSCTQSGLTPSAEVISPLSIQPKLTVGIPGDKYEQEADRVAEQVMRMSAPPVTPTQPQTEEEKQAELQTKLLAETIMPLVERQQALEDEEQVQAKCETCEEEEQIQRAAEGIPQVQPDLESRLSASPVGGIPLPDEVRSFMEPRFGADFSQVRAHTDGDAVQMKQDLGAQAFTHGSHIYYGAGEAPDKDELTGHELTHVVQQTHAPCCLANQQIQRYPVTASIPIGIDTTGINPELHQEQYGPRIDSITIKHHTDWTGHWWIELSDTESYGWWPSIPPVSTDSTDSLLSQAGYLLYQGIFQTALAGVEGELNAASWGGPNGRGTPTQDPYHGETSPVTSAHPYLLEGTDVRGSAQIVSEIRTFARSYRGDYRMAGGPNCETFIVRLLRDVGLAASNHGSSWKRHYGPVVI